MKAICIVPEYVGDLPSHGLGGITTYFMNMAAGYVRSGLETVVLTGAIAEPLGSRRTGPSGELVTAAYRHRSAFGPGLGGRICYELQREWRLARITRRLRDGVLVMEIPDWHTPLVAPAMVPRSALFMKLHGPSGFVRIINGQRPRPYWRVLDFRERFWASRVGLLEAGAQILVEYAEQHWGLARKIALTLDPIAIDLVSQEPTQVQLNPQKSDEVHILNVGRLEYRKGQHIVCQSLAMLRPELPPWRLHFVGPDSTSGPGKSSYKDYCFDLIPMELREQVSWHAPVTLSALSGLYRWADIVLISSLDGNYGYTTLHPVAAGSCVLSTLEPGQIDSAYVTHGLDGYLYPSTDPHALATFLRDLIADAGLRSSLRAGAVRRAAAELDPAIVAGKVLRQLPAGD